MSSSLHNAAKPPTRQRTYSSSSVSLRTSQSSSSGGSVSLLQNTGVRTINPERCGRYTLIAVIGRGGMGGVYLGVGSGVGGFRKLVVIKKIHAHLAEDHRFVTMFMDEARLAARMNHPNLVQTFEVGRDEQKIPFMAMEYMEGKSFSDVVKAALRAKRRLSTELVVNVMYHCLAGLHYAHELRGYDDSPLNIVHRDISPSNLFVTKEGVPKVLDFGIAKAEDSETTTRAGEIKGKYAYMSPEQAMGGELDRRSDLWSIGVSMFAALTGRHMFRAKSDVETIERVLTYPIEKRLDEERQLLDGRLRPIIAKCLDRDIDKRYSTAREIQEDLERLAREEKFSLAANDLAKHLNEGFGEEMEARRLVVSQIVNDFEEGTHAGGNTGSTAWTDVDPPKFEETSNPGAQTLRQGPSTWHFVLFSIVVLGGVFAMLKFFLVPSAPTASGPTASGEPSTNGEQLVQKSRQEILPLPLPPVPERKDVSTTASEVTTSESGGARDETQADANGAGAETSVAPQKSDNEKGRRRRRLRPVRKVTVESTVEPKKMEATVVAPEPKPEGYLTLISTPWADVYEGSKKLGTTPFIRKKFESGEHRLKLQTADGRTQTIELKVAPDKLTTKRIAF